ncbi:hypothetical protein BDQ17DRAFT_1433157 [Cyathus striatus]|nr:hypothetical protein BDQ17DRAFT_1433157 [Cyathus striatus]
MLKDLCQPLIDAISSPECRLEKLVLIDPPDEDHLGGNYDELAQTVIKMYKDTLADVEYLDTFILYDCIPELDLSNLLRLKNLTLDITAIDEDPTGLFKIAIQLISAAPKGNEVRKVHIQHFYVLEMMHFIDKSNGPTNWRFYDETHLLG